MLTHVLRGLRLCFGALLLVVAASPGVLGDVPGDDGWRRTAQGWERLPMTDHPRTISAAPRRDSAPPPLIHPLMLAALQVSLVAVAYWRCPVRTKSL